ncbi:carboxylesterase [Epibacterium sp. SM1979]|uniref:Carboxylesterase n=1 Tax=Tritonibacter litoralis TaxID=2662264 RepID=A0A843Y785_9RHOB|nr:holin family protein [Tritonibacter litoralis]MQQ07020.1 carboxylesterase [Tritonibacter litoralis]
MGMITQLFAVLFGGHRHALRETVEVFRENSEAASQRGHAFQMAALAQLAAEFNHPSKGLFDRLVDGLNRLPRPLFALGTLALLVSAMTDPVWFAARMQGIALVPEPLWWLFGVIVAFYFGARHQAKGQDFQRDLARSLARLPAVMQNLETLGAHQSPSDPGLHAVFEISSPPTDTNPALVSWQKAQGQKALVD